MKMCHLRSIRTTFSQCVSPVRHINADDEGVNVKFQRKDLKIILLKNRSQRPKTKRIHS